MELAAITWTIDPVAFEIGPVKIRWYGMCFLAAIITAIKIMEPMFKRIKRDPDEATSLTIHVVIGIVIGSRLVHCLAYDPVRYLSNPLRLFKIWEGGLSSHGATLGALIGSWVWVRGHVYYFVVWASKRTPQGVRTVFRVLFGEPVYNPGLSWRQMADIAAPAMATSICFIRLGNLFNHEIVGRPTDLPWAFIFTRYPLSGEAVPRHPSQIYEIIMGIVIFSIMYRIAWHRDKLHADGFRIFFFMWIYFILRFCVEFFKEVQSEFRDANPDFLLTMGQLLSIPFIIVLTPLVYWTIKRPAEGKEAVTTASKSK